MQAALSPQNLRQGATEVDDHVMSAEAGPQDREIDALMVARGLAAAPSGHDTALVGLFAGFAGRQPDRSARQADFVLADQIVEMAGKEVIDEAAFLARRKAALGKPALAGPGGIRVFVEALKADRFQ